MSISGNLEDASVADVMQFINLGGRSGTLILESEGARGEVGFFQGRIVSARSPSSKRLGELLVDRELVDEDEVSAALHQQAEERHRRSLGPILLERGVIEARQLYAVISDHIANTIYELVTWRRGRFSFALDELNPVDDLGVEPGELLPDLDLNTQMVILEALRLFDERNRGGQGKTTAPESERSTETTLEILLDKPPDLPGEELDELVALLQEDELGSAASEMTPRFCWIGDDDALLDALCSPERRRAEPTRLSLGELERLGDCRSAVVFVDARRGQATASQVQVVRRALPRAELTAVIDDTATVAELYRAGVDSIVPDDVDALDACLSRALESGAAFATAADADESGPQGLGRLRRVVSNLRSSLLSATAALSLMNIISESVERAILFIVRRDRLVMLGAFGSSKDGRLLAQAAHRLTLPLEASGLLRKTVNDAQTHSFRYHEARLPTQLQDVLGQPQNGQGVLFPVVGKDKVIAVVYADNGSRPQPIEEIELLELAAAQAGMALENEILHRRLSTSRR